MKRGYRAIERALAQPEPPPAPAAETPAAGSPSTGRQCSASEIRCRRYSSCRSGSADGASSSPAAGAPSAARSTTFLLGFRPESVTLLDAHEASLTADRRARESDGTVRYVLCDVRDLGRIERELAQNKPDVVFHLAAYKHVDWAEVYPEEFVDTNLHGSWNVLRAAERADVDTVVVASTDKAALAASFYGRTKRFMEQLTAFAARRAGGPRIAVRFVNVLGSAGSASELFLRQARGGVPLTVTDSGMVRYWITMAHAATLAAQGVLLASEGVSLATSAAPTTLTVGELAERIWGQAGRAGAPDLETVGIRPGETLSEVLDGTGRGARPRAASGHRANPRGDPFSGAGLGARAAIRTRKPRGVARHLARRDAASRAPGANGRAPVEPTATPIRKTSLDDPGDDSEGRRPDGR